MGVELHVHVQTVRYRIRQLRTLFGGTIDDPAGRFALAIALRIDPLVSREPTNAQSGASIRCVPTTDSNRNAFSDGVPGSAM
ncbi:helix-turn-helix domain-containing protein [Amycolatopsis decaplanina]|uniref:helix-turn-helix domain-containing protein n=1 Tax=Amycolatopsis decaplanina TaxID=208441 RepID=UPI001F3BE363|nr:helix-turn-helix domain-containing protein [Amycolatopsis decaplanina]